MADHPPPPPHHAPTPATHLPPPLFSPNGPRSEPDSVAEVRPGLLSRKRRDGSPRLRLSKPAELPKKIPMDHAAIVAATRDWISSMVIGLNLCPFAQRVFQADLIRYAVSDATDANRLRDQLAEELQLLVATPIAQLETTLLIHPKVLLDFSDYNDFLDVADSLLAEQRLVGVVQIASFHPSYQFAGTDADDVENYTNRSPYPMLHLLREESITRVASDPDELLEIPERNMRTLRSLGKREIEARLRKLRQGNA